MLFVSVLRGLHDGVVPLDAWYWLGGGVLRRLLVEVLAAADPVPGAADPGAWADPEDAARVGVAMRDCEGCPVLVCCRATANALRQALPARASRALC